jgi:hypothetical protein
MTAQEICTELQHRQAVPFDLETGITAGVYSTLRTVSETFYEELCDATNGFMRFKDKMFSAINWKGKTTDLLAVLVTDGEWTRQTLHVMAKVFDYVVPIGRIDELAQCIEAYLDGDRSRLKWFIDFRIRPVANRS